MRLIVMSVLAATALLFGSVRPATACDDDDYEVDDDDDDEALERTLDARFAGFEARIDALNDRIGSFGFEADDDDADWDSDDDDDEDDESEADDVVDFDFDVGFVELY